MGNNSSKEDKRPKSEPPHSSTSTKTRQPGTSQKNKKPASTKKSVSEETDVTPQKTVTSGSHGSTDRTDKKSTANVTPQKTVTSGSHGSTDRTDKKLTANDDDEGQKILNDIEDKKKYKLLVAAIDFGTTYSGYAFFMKDDYEKIGGDNSKIHCPSWIRDGGMSYKAPTTVLFRPNKTFHSFGYDAEKFYHDNSDSIDFKEWYFFKHFKMKLFTDRDMLSKDTIIEDNREAGNIMKAVDVFAAVISYFKKHMMDSMTSRNDDENFIINDDIHWVITVPAIWDLKAKQFMKDAAEKAGISEDQLTLALEPEAASLYCRKVPVSVETSKDGGKMIAAMDKGSQYIVFDQGGGTTDITVHEVTGPDTLKEIHQACGGHYGGNTVNAEFFRFLSRLFGGPVIQDVRTKNPSEYFDLMTNFEHKKTGFSEKHSSDDKGVVTLRVPVVWMETYKAHTDESLEEALPNTTFSGKVTAHKDKLRINNKIFRSFFDYSINNVLKVFENLFQKQEIANVKTMLAVGGYSESPVLIDAIKQKFPHLIVIVPRDPGLAVLKGAVLYGFEPHSITERRSPFTYGVAMQMPYDPEKYDKSKISQVKGRGGKIMVDDVFDKHIEIGQISRIGEFEKEHDYFPLVNDQMIAHFEFYASENKNPKYTTDDKCQMIGTYHVTLTRDSPQDGKLFLKLNASGTEILAVVREEATGIEKRAYFSLF